LSVANALLLRGITGRSRWFRRFARRRRNILARIDAVRARIQERNGGHSIFKRGETWRNLIDEGRRI